MKILRTIPDFSEYTAVAMGLFDGVHIGHQKVINTVVKSSYLPIVFTFNTKNMFPKSKDGLLLLSFDSVKYELIEKLGVKVVIEPPFESIKDIKAQEFIHKYLAGKLHAKMVVCGKNFRFGQNALGDSEILKKQALDLNINTKIVDSIIYDKSPVSSSRIRSAIANADLKLASKLLGYNYFWEYKVVKGDQNGRKIGYPTINQKFPNGYVIPKRGVYASKVLVDNKTYLGVTNIGVRPSLNELENPIAETYIIDYNKRSLYGEKIRVSINRYLREEKKFYSIAKLKNEICSNVSEVLELYNK